jgi:oxygen-independent coproporphyrinogen-3 oxidase
MSDLIDLLHKLNKPIPRYTSYPTAPNWETLSPATYEEKLAILSKQDEPLSLYFHLPFCHSMCLFCGCSVVLNRKQEKEVEYVDYLCQEIEMVALHLGKRKKVRQLHFGGGTPTKLSFDLLQKILDKIQTHFEIDFSGEIAIEIDPRTVFSDSGTKLKFLKSLGFNRVSFGVQDTNEKVQEAIKRHQSEEMSHQTFFLAKEIGFDEINLDLIYGLPLQTVDTFQKTVESILSLRPDRIALFSYAKVPWLKAHQKAIKEKDLPSLEAKFEIYTQARKAFIDAGYVAIGMDHFALEKSELSKSYHTKTLHRNFQGYTVQKAHAMISFGITAIGYLENTYVQNLKELPQYYQALQKGFLPVHRGKVLTQDDIVRKWTIEKLMCTFTIDKQEFKERFQLDFDSYFGPLDFSEYENLMINSLAKITVSPLGELFVRNCATLFDGYLTKPSLNPQFSQSI